MKKLLIAFCIAIALQSCVDVDNKEGCVVTQIEEGYSNCVYSYDCLTYSSTSQQLVRTDNNGQFTDWCNKFKINDTVVFTKK
jgi:hypothetical protein